MSKKRMVQHRPQRDAGTRENARLRQEVESLRRQVSRLRKDNERLRATPEVEASPTPRKPKPRTCPKCGTEPIRFTTPRGKVIVRCPGCGVGLSR